MHRPRKRLDVSTRSISSAKLPARGNLGAICLVGACLSTWLCLPVAAQNSQNGTFQRIRTFDPNKGLVPGNGTQSTNSVQTYSAPSGWSTQQANPTNSSPQTTGDASNGTDEQSQNSHHKHHHKFLIFGHHGEEGSGLSENAENAQSTTTSPANISPPTDSQTYNSSPVVMPRPGFSVISPVVPPDPRPRPQSPAVDQAAHLPMVQNAGAKPALAWRARAWKLATEPDDATSTARHPSRVLNCSMEEALAAVANCCKSKGGQIIGQSVAAGQLGARFSDGAGGRALVVFVAKSVGNNRTILKACADSDRAQRIALLNDLILQTAAIIDGKGLL